jgi:mannose-6-phosphate isomerase-like protein (cupin superfamily)
MNIARFSEARTSYEYGCDLRRLYPWPGVADPLWGSAIASVRPGEATSVHAHDEEETFIILTGSGEMWINGQVQSVSKGDVIYLPRNSRHSLRNASLSEPVEFLTIYWGSPEADSRMVKMVHQLAGSEP